MCGVCADIYSGGAMLGLGIVVLIVLIALIVIVVLMVLIVIVVLIVLVVLIMLVRAATGSDGGGGGADGGSGGAGAGGCWSAGEKQACTMKAEEMEAFKRSDCAVMNELTYYYLIIDGIHL